MSCNTPLMEAKMVELATLVNSKLALTLQLAMNQNKQKNKASLAVSFFVKERLFVVGHNVNVCCFCKCLSRSNVLNNEQLYNSHVRDQLLTF